MNTIGERSHLRLIYTNLAKQSRFPANQVKPRNSNSPRILTILKGQHRTKKRKSFSYGTTVRPISLFALEVFTSTFFGRATAFFNFRNRAMYSSRCPLSPSICFGGFQVGFHLCFSVDAWEFFLWSIRFTWPGHGILGDFGILIWMASFGLVLSFFSELNVRTFSPGLSSKCLLSILVNRLSLSRFTLPLGLLPNFLLYILVDRLSLSSFERELFSVWKELNRLIFFFFYTTYNRTWH